jgi:hypothetical protein
MLAHVSRRILVTRGFSRREQEFEYADTPYKVSNVSLFLVELVLRESFAAAMNIFRGIETLRIRSKMRSKLGRI